MKFILKDVVYPNLHLFFKEKINKKEKEKIVKESIIKTKTITENGFFYVNGCLCYKTDNLLINLNIR